MGDASPLFSTHARENTTASLSVFHLWVLLYPLVLTRLALAEAGSSFLVVVGASCRPLCAAQTGLLQAESSLTPAACTRTGLVELSATLALSTDGLSIDLQRRHTIERSS